MKPSKAATGFKVNVNKENKGGSTPVIPGVYQGRASYKIKKSSSDKDMLSIEFTLLGKDSTGKSVVGRKVFDNVTFEESMIWKWNSLYNMATGEDIPDSDFTFDEMVGLVGEAINNKVFNLELTTEVYGDKENNKIAKYLK